MRYLRTGTWTRCLVAFAAAFAILAAPTGASASGQWDFLLAPESACPGQSDSSLSQAARGQVMVCMYNWARAQEGLPPLVVVKQLRISSTRKARDIRRCQQFSHEACGRNTFYWFRRVGFMRGSFGAGEILANGPAATWTARETMSEWLASDEHRPVILMPSFNEVGVSEVTGRLQGRTGMAIWVAHFGYHRHAQSAASSGGNVYSQLVETLSSSYGTETGANPVPALGSALYVAP
jgi:uncharacterized protein YkwD